MTMIVSEERFLFHFLPTSQISRATSIVQRASRVSLQRERFIVTEASATDRFVQSRRTTPYRKSLSRPFGPNSAIEESMWCEPVSHLLPLVLPRDFEGESDKKRPAHSSFWENSPRPDRPEPVHLGTVAGRVGEEGLIRVPPRTIAPACY